MNTRTTLVLAATGLALVSAFAWRAADRAEPERTHALVDAAASHGVAGEGGPDGANPVAPPGATTALPRLVELGSDSCHSCRAMIPVLEELRCDNGHALQVDFIDVWKDPDGAEPYGVSIIPTQVLFAPDGRELWRHTGFISAGGLRARFRELGHPVDDAPAPGDRACAPSSEG